MLFLFAAGLLAAGGTVVFRAKAFDPATWTQQVTAAGQALVRESLREDLKAAFSTEEETVVEALPEGKVRVSGWVDLMREDGQSDRQNFSVVVHKSDIDEWVGEKITVLPQM